MKVLACVLAILASSALGFDMQVSAKSSLALDLAEAKNRPVTKVITLLKDMLKQLEKEAKEDEDIYDKMACWCGTNDKEKTKSIADAEERLEDLGTAIEELTAGSARLNTEIKNLEKEIAKNQAALDKATAIREKQVADFNDEEKDLLESISALKAAITVLGKHNSALVQVPRSHMLGIAATLQHEVQKHSALLHGVLTHKERRVVDAFVQSPEDYFDAEPTFKQNYPPASGEIFGILNQMKDTFEANLSDSQKEELANQKAYEDLKAGKTGEIQAGQDQVKAKVKELATTDEKNAQSKQDVEDTTATLSADEEFLRMLKEKCSMTDAEWEERTKTRQLEMEACSKALAVLSSDDAHDLFSKTFSLVQKQSVAHSKRRQAASKLLKTAAQKHRSPRLALLATEVQLDAFTKVKKAIDDMIADLLKEKEDEIKHKDFCNSEFNKNELSTEKQERHKSDVLANIDDLEQNIKELTEALDTLNSEVAELQLQLKRAGEDREIQNKEFQQTVADQQASTKLLQAALGILNGFYAKKDVLASALVQKQGPPAPAGFEKYEKNAAAGGVIGMITQIINDSKALEAETIRSEEDAQKAYEDYVKETNTSIHEKSKDIVHKSTQKAKAEADLVEANEQKEAVKLELDELSNYNAELHASCDFVVKNFEIRQTARDEEVEALRQAKAILSGAKFEEFLQAA